MPGRYDELSMGMSGDFELAIAYGATTVRARGLPVAVIMYAGEGHGFRRADTIISATQAQVYFLGRVLGFTPADEVPPIPIDNLPA